MVLNTAASISFSQINSTGYFTNGNLGINTIEPSANLHVNGTIIATGLSSLENTIVTNLSTGGLIASTGVTSANINVSGLSNLANATIINISTGVLVASTGVTAGTISVSGLSSLTNVIATNVSSGVLFASTGITTGTISVSGLSAVANVTATNISSGVVIATTGVTAGTINVSGLSTLSNTTVTNISAGGTSILQNVTATNMTSSTLIATTSVSSGLLSATNVIGNSISAGTLSSTTITGANLSLSGNLNIAGTLTTVNITSTNLVQTNVSAASIYASGTTTLQDVRATYIRLDSGTSVNIVGNADAGNLTQTYIAFGEAGATTDCAYLRQIGSVNAMKIALDFHDDGSEPGFCIRSVAAGTPDIINERFTVQASGNVGIGTSSPGYKLDVNGTIHAQNELYIGTANGPGTIYLGGGDDQDETFNLSVIETRLYSGSENTELLLFKGNDISGSGGPDRIRLRGGALAFDTYSSATTDRTSENIRMFINDNGNIGIGTTSPSGMLHLNNAALFTSTGNLTCTGDVISFGSLSDARLKKNIQTIETQHAIDIVSKLRSVSFDWNDNIFNEEKRNTSDLGFIAQEVEALVPEAVSEYKEVSTGEVYKRIKHERLIPYLLSAIQYLLNKE